MTSLEIWNAVSQTGKPGRAARRRYRREWAVIRNKRQRRARRWMQGVDPLARPARDRLAAARRDAENAARLAALDAEAKARRATRDALIAAGRAARGMGLAVRASHDRSGRLSSYYARADNGAVLRISDHEIPPSDRRDYMAAAHGRAYHTGYHGAQIIIDRPRSATWIRRALTLAIAGRSVS